jgi:hypothetical protein
MISSGSGTSLFLERIGESPFLFEDESEDSTLTTTMADAAEGAGSGAGGGGTGGAGGAGGGTDFLALAAEKTTFHQNKLTFSATEKNHNYLTTHSIEIQKNLTLSPLLLR